jgi:hypothetical protein
MTVVMKVPITPELVRFVPAQHAKFYPNGTQLIFCANPSAKATNFAIASIDISKYVG